MGSSLSRPKREGSATKMENLPNEILFSVFSNLNVIDQLNVSLVCTRFQSIIENVHLPRFLEIDTGMYSTNMYYGINNFISLYDKACEKFKIKSVRISNTIHSLTSSKADLEEEVYFNFTECPAVMKQEMFSAKYVDAKDVRNLKKLIHCRGIAKAFVGKELFQDMFDVLTKTADVEALKNIETKCRVCKTSSMSWKGLVQHLKSKSHNLLTNLKHKNCGMCLENLWSAGFLNFEDLRTSRLYRDLEDMIVAKNKAIFGRNYTLTRSDGFLENLILGLLVQSNLNSTIESLNIAVKMNDSAMFEMFDMLR